MDDLRDPIPSALRWLLLLPLSLAAGWVAGGLVVHWVPTGAGGPLAYAAAGSSGVVYAYAALWVARSLAPAHAGVVVLVLGLLILGDSGLVHLVLQTNLMPEASRLLEPGGPVSAIAGVLRTQDFVDLQGGGIGRFAGVLVGCLASWGTHVRRRRARACASVTQP